MYLQRQDYGDISENKKYFRLWPIYYYSSRIVSSHIGLPIEFGQTGNSAIRFADPENPTVRNIVREE